MTKTLGNQTSGAIFSPCMKYRYVLWRDLYADWLPGSLPKNVRGDAVFICLNPSTADHEQLDPTCRRCLSWTRAWNCRRYLMMEGESRMRTRLAEALRLWIVTHEVEQQKLAKDWGCSQAVVSRFLAGECIPEAKTMLRIIAWSLETEGAKA